MLAVLKKEFKSYFLTPIGYIFIGSFVALLSFFFYLDVFKIGSVSFSDIFYSGATILTFIIPVLTMRTFAEERKNGTEELLLTTPVSIVKVVIAKFLAALLVILITEALSLVYYLILKQFGDPNVKLVATTLFGFLLLAAAYISFGMFASSITENQIIACILTIGGLVASMFLPSLSGYFYPVALISIFDKFPSGVISIADIITFISFTLLFLFFTAIIMQRRKSYR